MGQLSLPRIFLCKLCQWFVIVPNWAMWMRLVAVSLHDRILASMLLLGRAAQCFA